MPDESRPSLTLVLPAYNEAARLGSALDELFGYLGRTGEARSGGRSASELGAWDVLLVDDGSEDDTVAVAEARPEARPGVDGEAPSLRVLRQPHGGKGAAVRAGVLAATADVVVFADSDMATPPDQLPLLTAALVDHQVALGSRVQPDGTDRRSSQPFHRRALGKMFHALAGAWVTGSVPDSQCGFKGFQRAAGQDLFARQQITSIVFDAEIIHLARKRGYGVAIVPVQWTDQRGSRMRVRPGLAIRVAWDLIQILSSIGEYHAPDRPRSSPRQPPGTSRGEPRRRGGQTRVDGTRMPTARGRDGPAARDTLDALETYTASRLMTAPSTPLPTSTSVGPFVVRRTPLDDIPRDAWDRLLAVTARPTPFSRWTLHRAWWDAYGSTAHEQYLVYGRAAADAAPIAARDIVAIVPLMHRHEVEPEDAASFTKLRRPVDGTPVSPDATAVFMAASYHADYATILCHPDDLAAVCGAVVESLASLLRSTEPWDVLDLRRLRDDDPALPALMTACLAGPTAWSVTREQEDVCPVVSLPAGGWDDYLGTLDKKARHEGLRRKLRRAEATGDVTFRQMPLDAASIDAFIDLHQRRWGDDGLFPDTEGGGRSRRFLHRLTELEAAEGADAQLQLGQVFVGERLIFAGVGFDDGQTCYFYNAGADPDARELSPGVTGTAAYIRDRIEAGRTRFDFLRGNEPYKYEWGAVDEAIHRLVVVRDAA